MNKLKKNNEFQKVYRNGIKITGRYVIIFKNSSKIKKFGVVASKKTGNSVYRSRAKRLLREIIRKNTDKFEDKFDYILVMKSNFRENYNKIKYQDIVFDVLQVLRRTKNEKNNNKNN